MGSSSSTIGGGEVLEHVGNGASSGPSYLDELLIQLFNSMPYVKYIIYALIIVLASLLILRLFKIKSIFKGKGIEAELQNVKTLKKRDTYIIKANKMLLWATKLVEKSPLSLSREKKEYWQYNLRRLGVKIPGGYRDLQATEFNALIQVTAFAMCMVSIIVMVFVNYMLGILLIMSVLIAAGTLPMTVIRSMVAQRDLEIKSNFANYYLMLHYVIIAGSKADLGSVMKSYAKTTSSVEMQKYVEACLNHIETHGEYEATRYIAKDYQEVAEVGKLMRLIRQANEGGNVNEELVGFRAELMSAKRYAVIQRREQLILKAQHSFNILMIVLIQAVLSAMSIYLEDMQLMTSLFGG